MNRALHTRLGSLAWTTGMGWVAAQGGCAPLDDAPEFAEVAPTVALQLSPDVRIAPPIASGTGCRSDSVRLTPATPNDQAAASFDLSFNSYGLSAGSSTGLQPQSTDCAIEIVVSARPGTRFALAEGSFGGSANIAQGTRMAVESGYGFVDFGSFHQRTDTIAGPYGNYATNPQDRWVFPLPPPTPEWSACGASHTLRIRSRLWLQKLTSEGKGSVAMDRVTGWLVAPGMQFRFFTGRPCTPGTGPE